MTPAERRRRLERLLERAERDAARAAFWLGWYADRMRDGREVELLVGCIPEGQRAARAALDVVCIRDLLDAEPEPLVFQRATGERVIVDDRAMRAAGELARRDG